jgi:hypothetical protein
MSVRRDKRWNTYFYRKTVCTPDGRKVRIFGTPKAEGLPETRAGAEEAERRAITRVLNTGKAAKPVTERKEIPTVRAFSKTFIETSQIKNVRPRCNPSGHAAPEVLRSADDDRK